MLKPISMQRAGAQDMNKLHLSFTCMHLGLNENPYAENIWVNFRHYE